MSSVIHCNFCKYCLVGFWAWNKPKQPAVSKLAKAKKKYLYNYFSCRKVTVFCSQSRLIWRERFSYRPKYFGKSLIVPIVLSLAVHLLPSSVYTTWENSGSPGNHRTDVNEGVRYQFKIMWNLAAQKLKKAMFIHRESLHSNPFFFSFLCRSAIFIADTYIYSAMFTLLPKPSFSFTTAV